MEDLVRDKSRNVHLQIAPNTFAFVESYNSKLNTGYKFSLEKFEGQKLIYKLMADRILLDTINGSWKFKTILLELLALRARLL